MSSWLPFYHEVVQVLASYEDRQDELIALLREMKARGLSALPLLDQNADGAKIEMREIDPFTFLANFHRSGDDSRRAMWSVLREKWDLKEQVPKGFGGLPTVHATASWFFPYENSRDADDVPSLWRLFNASSQSAPPALNGELWTRALKIEGVGVAKMSGGLFWINSRDYLSLDGWMVKYLARASVAADLRAIERDWSAYIELIAQVHETVGENHVHLSREAWRARDTSDVAAPEASSEMARPRRYWAGGHDWEEGGSQLGRFKENNEWQLGYSEQTGTPVARRLVKLFGQIAIGDDFAIKGCGGTRLKVHYLGRVRAINAATRTLQLDALPKRELYVGPKPAGKGAGNWTESLLEIKRPADIAQIFGTEEETAPQLPERLPDVPLNLILYGPPGTGKTYNTISRAVQIADGIERDRATESKRFEELRGENRIGFVTFHQSYAYEEFIEGLRPDVDESARGGASYSVRAGTLKTMALRALGACLERAAPESATFEDVWDFLLEGIQLHPDHEIAGLSNESAYRLTPTAHGNLQAINMKSTAGTLYSCPRVHAETVWNKFRDAVKVNSTQVFKAVGNSHTNLIGAVVNELKRLEPDVKQTEKIPIDPISIARSYLDGSPDYRLKDDLTRVPPYVLIVDEINRGNISKILGELITLLEDDKRIGAPNALRVILPYSGETFALPPNLYLIGTMNTADKSLALLDVALRRRFVFEEMAPDFSTDVCPNLPAEMRAIVQELNRRLLRVLDREHRLGHAFFIHVRDKDAFNKVFELKIVPLLQEFFYNDWEGLNAVLGETGDGKIVRKLAPIKEMRGRNQFGWWNDEDLETPDFLAVLRANYKMPLLNAPIADAPIAATPPDADASEAA